MEKKNSKAQGPLVAGVIAVTVIANLAFQVFILKDDVKDLKMELRMQEDHIRSVEERVEVLFDQSKFIKDSSYRLIKSDKETNQNENVVRVLIELKHDLISEGPINLYYKAIEDDTWLQKEMTQNFGESTLVADFSYDHDYEMKVAYVLDGKEITESIPSLDIYSKESLTWDSDIQTHSVKKQVVDYTIQVARYNNLNDSKLDSVICELYYDEVLIDQFELQDFMATTNQKKPKAQLEHGEDYWYANRIVSIETDETIISERIRYKVIIKNDRQTSFERTYFVE